MGRGFESLQARLSDGSDMVGVAQLVSAPDCGSGGRGFESLYPPCSSIFINIYMAGELSWLEHAVHTRGVVGSNPIPATYMGS